jgi:decaprenyl-phosphate phosphoribosyltransferase
MNTIKHYIAIARPGHWFKNIFMLPGIVIAFLITWPPIHTLIVPIIIGFISTCAIASANYVINEWLDADFDKFHPLKKNRPSVLGHIEFKYVMVEYIALAIFGLILAWFVSALFFICSVWLLVMGILYNVRPFRTKDKPYLDVLSESINNPIRLLLGWGIVTSVILPPSSLIIAYWMAGAFLMATKRFAELRLITDRSTAALYRKSFAYYTENNLIISILFYGMSFAFFFAVFMIKYKIELLITLPLFALMFAWYLHIGMMQDSPAQRPERLYEQKAYMLFIGFVICFLTLMFFIEWPTLNWFLEKTFN